MTDTEPELSALIERLRELNDKATPGEWKESCIGSEGYIIRSHDGETLAERGVRLARIGDGEWEQDKANAELIVAARNALPVLLDEIEGLQQAIIDTGGVYIHIDCDDPVHAENEALRERVAELEAADD